MTEFDDAVDALLSEAPTVPGLQDVEAMVRRRRVRHRATIVVVAVVIAAATASVAGALGHRASGPQIAVSPTTTTVSDTSASACALGRLRQQKANLERLEKQLNEQLATEQREHSPNAGATDAAHQSVLREMSDVDHRILSTQAADGEQPDLRSSAAPLDPEACCGTTTTSTLEPAAEWTAQWQSLDTQRVQLALLEKQLNQQLTDELAAYSPNAATTDAAHQAVLRQQSDVQQRILQLEQNRPDAPTCPRSDGPGASSDSSSP